MNSNSNLGALNPDRRFLLDHLGFDKSIVRATGHELIDADGRAYLDFLSQYGAIPFGHNPPDLWRVVQRHGRTDAPTFVQPLLSPGADRLASRLVALAPGRMRYCTFVNSGAEATEAAIKLARARTGRQHILSAQRGYHGKTLGALSATDNPAYRTPFLLCTTAFDRVPFDDLEALEARLAQGDVAAFIVEAVQGEGGMRPASPGYLAAASRLCRAHGALLVVDEVQTGLGRTGSLFACEAEPGLEPDIVLLAKALGGGLFPLGAMLCNESSWAEAFGAYHSSTFVNSHLSCEVGNAVLDRLLADDRHLVAHARRMGELLQQGLDDLVEAFPLAYAARSGRGLMQGLRLARWTGDDSYFAAHASFHGQSVALLAGHLLNEHAIVTAPVMGENATLRLQPSLTIQPHEIERVLAALRSAAELIESRDLGPLIRYLPGPATVARVSKATIASSSMAMPSIDPAPALPKPWFATPRPALPIVSRDSVALPKASPDAHRGRFAFLIHPTDDESLFDILPSSMRGLDADGRDGWRRWMSSWFDRMHQPATVYDLPALRSRRGGHASGCLIASPLKPRQMMELRRTQKQSLLAAYLDVARAEKADIVGLGAFTSVISRGGLDLSSEGLNLTSGNSLTALSSVESLVAVAREQGRCMASETVGVVG